MSMQRTPRQLEVTIPDTLYQWLLDEAQRRAQDISVVVQTGLEYYLDIVRLRRRQALTPLAPLS